ncbi:hypothetical protein Tco_1085071 [Tanacetum coccineum]
MSPPTTNQQPSSLCVFQRSSVVVTPVPPLRWYGTFLVVNHIGRNTALHMETLKYEVVEEIESRVEAESNVVKTPLINIGHQTWLFSNCRENSLRRLCTVYQERIAAKILDTIAKSEGLVKKHKQSTVTLITASPECGSSLTYCITIHLTYAVAYLYFGLIVVFATA